MADFFDDRTTDSGSSDAQAELEKIKVGDQEYTQDQLSRYVGLGKIAEESEIKWNTKIDKLYPSYSKSQNELKELKEQKSKWDQEQSQRSQQMNIPEDEAIKQARDAARKVGIVTEEDFQSVLGKNFRQYYLQERAAEKLLDEAGELEKKYKGENGLPAFDKDVIFEHMLETGIKNPEKAYKDKYETQIDQWKEQEYAKAKRPGLRTSVTSIGGKMPVEQRPTKQNLHQLVADSLHLSDE